MLIDPLEKRLDAVAAADIALQRQAIDPRRLNLIAQGHRRDFIAYVTERDLITRPGQGLRTIAVPMPRLPPVTTATLFGMTVP